MPNLPLTPLPPHSSPVPFRTPSVLIAPRVGVPVSATIDYHHIHTFTLPACLAPVLLVIPMLLPSSIPGWVPTTLVLKTYSSSQCKH